MDKIRKLKLGIINEGIDTTRIHKIPIQQMSATRESYLSYFRTKEEKR
jgi:hypothetical protein